VLLRGHASGGQRNDEGVFSVLIDKDDLKNRNFKKKQ